MTVRQVQAITYTPPRSSGAVAREEDPAQQEMNFLQLLIAQIANQTPDNPMDSTAIATQFSQMQAAIGLVKLNASSSAYQQTSIANALMNRPVKIQDPAADPALGPSLVEGEVTAIDFTGQQPMVKVGDRFHPLQSVIYVGS